MAEIPSLGQVAFEAYAKNTSGRSLVSGAQLPVWDQLKPDIRQAWEVAAAAVQDEVFKRMPSE